MQRNGVIFDKYLLLFGERRKIISDKQKFVCRRMLYNRKNVD
jgi:hypothetical protein